MTTRNDRTKLVTFIDIPERVVMEYVGKLSEVRFQSIQVVITTRTATTYKNADGDLETVHLTFLDGYVIQDEHRNYKGSLKHGFCAAKPSDDLYREICQESHTVVLPDSVFCSAVPTGPAYIPPPKIPTPPATPTSAAAALAAAAGGAAIDEGGANQAADATEAADQAAATTGATSAEADVAAAVSNTDAAENSAAAPAAAAATVEAITSPASADESAATAATVTDSITTAGTATTIPVEDSVTTVEPVSAETPAATMHVDTAVEPAAAAAVAAVSPTSPRRTADPPSSSSITSSTPAVSRNRRPAAAPGADPPSADEVDDDDDDDDAAEAAANDNDHDANRGRVDDDEAADYRPKKATAARQKEQDEEDTQGDDEEPNSHVFLQHGLDAVLDFYRNCGGRVVIMCIEEEAAQGKLQQNLGPFLSHHFGCAWQLGAMIDNTNARCHPTSRAKLLLGLHLPSLYFGRGHLMRSLAVVPSDEEGVYETSLLTESEYTAIVQPHKTTSSSATVPTHLSSYADYVRVTTGQYGIALHQDPTTGGQLIWMGDRKPQDPAMRDIFAQMLTLKLQRAKQLEP